MIVNICYSNNELYIGIGVELLALALVEDELLLLFVSVKLAVFKDDS